MTTLLQEFEEWVKQYYLENGHCLHVAMFVESGINKLDELKEKHKTKKWTMPEKEFRWLAFQHEYKMLKKKYNVTS